jgi:hypothetical protein
MFANAAGVPAAPPVSGLVASAGPPPTIDRWESGLAWIPERCATTYQLVPICDEPAVGYEAPRPGAAYYQPVGLRVADQCSTMGGPVDIERVRRVAEAQTPFAIARELWDGELTQTDPYDVGGQTVSNAYLASSDAEEVGTGAAEARVAIGRLEQAALESTHGQPVMLHVPILVLPQLHGYVRAVGQTLVTLAGNVLVADGGYPGTGPAGQAAGATVWAYATSPVQVLTSPLVVIEGDDAIDPSTNTRTVWAARVFAATFDPCVHLATEITL